MKKVKYPDKPSNWHNSTVNADACPLLTPNINLKLWGTRYCPGVFNAQNTVERSINSVLGQKFKTIEYIIIDGASTDDTCKIINDYWGNIDVFISERDKGIYDAMNKGIALATDDAIGIINAADFFADEDVSYNVAKEFAEKDIPIL